MSLVNSSLILNVAVSQEYSGYRMLFHASKRNNPELVTNRTLTMFHLKQGYCVHVTALTASRLCDMAAVCAYRCGCIGLERWFIISQKYNINIVILFWSHVQRDSTAHFVPAVVPMGHNLPN